MNLKTLGKESLNVKNSTKILSIYLLVLKLVVRISSIKCLCFMPLALLLGIRLHVRRKAMVKTYKKPINFIQNQRASLSSTQIFGYWIMSPWIKNSL